ncbi:MAG: TatD DNase family protein [Paraglaciecola sp.]|jgi:TatD DNase family protein
MVWFDVGVNLMDKRLSIDAVLERANLANVKQLLITGTSVEESRKAVTLAEQHPERLYCTAGIHPHHAKDASASYLDELRTLAALPQVLAIGECGLDFNRNFSPPEQQLAVFEQQLILAAELQKPLFLHERDAFCAQVKLLEKHHASLAGGVAHCFTGDKQQMQTYLDLGFYIGITGWVCDQKRGQALREAVRELPLDRLLLETDAPYLKPKTLSPQERKLSSNNEPCYLPHIAAQLATLMNVQCAELQQHSYRNSCQLFGLHSNNPHAN